MRTREIERPQQSLPFMGVSIIDPPLEKEARQNLSDSPFANTRANACSQLSLETTLAEIWGQVLHLPSISVHHNFFDLGGDTLRSLEVCTLAKKRGVHFSVQQFCQYPTIHTLTQFLQCNTRHTG